jgi:vacuolar-type H+-ATPase catalytic subunit A/Vma1
MNRDDMARVSLNEDTLKQALKEALVEALQEQRELLYEVFTEVLEDFALTEAIREGQQTKSATREEVFRIIQGKG